MTPLTETEKLARTKRRELYWKWGLIVGGLIALFLIYQGCQKSKNAQLAYDNIEKALKNVLSNEKTVRDEAKRLEKENGQLDSAIADLIADRDMIQGALIDESDKSKRLALEVKKARSDKDTVKYYEHCDSLATVVESLWYAVRKGDTIAMLLQERENLVVNNLNQQLSVYQEAYDSCLSAVRFASNTLPAIKPKSKLYIDGAVMTAYTNGIGGGLSLIDTKGNRFAGKYLMTNNGAIYMVEYGRLLSLKRKK